jgi:hypothetical protein
MKCKSTIQNKLWSREGETCGTDVEAVEVVEEASLHVHAAKDEHVAIDNRSAGARACGGGCRVPERRAG